MDTSRRASIDALLDRPGVRRAVAARGVDAQGLACIRDIVASEWEMVDRVEGLGGRAGCQDDAASFAVHRLAQHLSFPHGSLPAIRDEHVRAARDGRNLVAEKYARMMELTDPAYFERAWRPVLADPSPVKRAALDEIEELVRAFARDAAAVYPTAQGHGRPERSAPGAVSAAGYFRSEACTYGLQTLYGLLDGLRDQRARGINPVSDTYESAVLILNALGA